jgi:flavodoxin I
MQTVGLFYGSSSGVTKNAAKQIAEDLKKTGIEVELIDVAVANSSMLGAYKHLIFGTSTWGLGDLQDDWEGFIGDLEKSDLGGKKVALFGAGDQDGYPDTFVDGMGILYDAAMKAGADIVGSFPVDGYSYDSSKAERDGEFVGLPIDEDNQADLTVQRIGLWTESIAEYMKA